MQLEYNIDLRFLHLDYLIIMILWFHSTVSGFDDVPCDRGGGRIVGLHCVLMRRYWWSALRVHLELRI